MINRSYSLNFVTLAVGLHQVLDFVIQAMNEERPPKSFENVIWVDIRRQWDVP